MLTEAHRVKPTSLASFNSTLGIGSGYTVTGFSIKDFSKVRILISTDGRFSVGLKQSMTNSPWDITSGVAVTSGGRTVENDVYGLWGEFQITTVLSASTISRVLVQGFP